MWIAFGVGAVCGAAFGFIASSLFSMDKICDLTEANQLLLEEIGKLRERQKMKTFKINVMEPPGKKEKTHVD